MTSGVINMLMGAWIMAGGPVSLTITWPFLCVAPWVGFTLNVQDLRDEAGDRATGRLTMPVLVGTQNARKVWTAEFGIFSAIALYVLRKRLSIGDTIFGVGGIGLMIQSLLAKNTHDDNILHRNYVMFFFPLFARAAFWVSKSIVGV